MQTSCIFTQQKNPRQDILFPCFDGHGRGPVSAISRKRAEVLGQGDACRDGAGHDQNGVIAGDRPEDLGELLLVDRLGDGLGAARYRMENDELTDPVHP